ncbi:hypothetical protein [Paucisalibacillus globulus]|uniref:hypothetical protein n=1 Tax=Paucisalibacillus globulus TaxID=351095 RepID=UPI00041A7098|nr:hypothetical protein [Paucisalibacillus globulus]
MSYYFNPEVKLLLVNQSDNKVTVRYGNNRKFHLPEIGPRPPYFTNPTYQQYYPKL